MYLESCTNTVFVQANKPQVPFTVASVTTNPNPLYLNTDDILSRIEPIDIYMYVYIKDGHSPLSLDPRSFV